MTLSLPRAVLFDWDNTLVDTWPLIHRALHETFTAMGHTPWTLEEVQQKVRYSARDAFPALFGDDWQRAANLYRDAYRALNIQHLAPLPQAQELLDWLYNRGIQMAVVSNKMGDTLRAESTHLGWDKYFAALIGTMDTPHDKPHPAPVFKALEQLNKQHEGCHTRAGGNDKQNIWFMGDSEVDVEVANRAEIVPILYGERATPDADKSQHFGGFPFTRHYRDHHAVLAELIALL
jgi:phosphoglycolate phosphatase